MLDWLEVAVPYTYMNYDFAYTDKFSNNLVFLLG